MSDKQPLQITVGQVLKTVDAEDGTFVPNKFVAKFGRPEDKVNFALAMSACAENGLIDYKQDAMTTLKLWYVTDAGYELLNQ